MKNKLIHILLSSITLIPLSACSTTNAENLMTDVNEAVQKNSTLENATYIWSLSYQPGDFIQTAEGVFISRGDGEYDWTYKEYHGNGPDFAQTAEIDGRQYELFSVDEPDFEPEWQKAERDLMSAHELLSPLFENPIEAEYVDEIKVTEENGKRYEITYDNAYLEDSNTESIQDLEESKTELEEAGDQTGYIEALEEQINNLENMEFSNPLFELEINSEGYLTKYTSSYTFSTPEEEPVTATLRYELTDYNLDDATSLMPAIE